MINQNLQNLVYTPEEVAEILKLNKSTIYELIKSGEIVARKIGRVYRIPASWMNFTFTGLDYDLYQAEREDFKNIEVVQKELSRARQSL